MELHKYPPLCLLWSSTGKNINILVMIEERVELLLLCDLLCSVDLNRSRSELLLSTTREANMRHIYRAVIFIHVLILLIH